METNEELLERQNQELTDALAAAKQHIKRLEVFLQKKGTKAIYVYYAVKRGNLFMEQYKNMRASWTCSPDAAWTTHLKDGAEFFAKETHGRVVEIAMVVTPLR